MKWKKQLADFLYFSRQERQGVSVLLLLIFFIQILSFYRHSVSRAEPADFQYMKKAAAFYILDTLRPPDTLPLSGFPPVKTEASPASGDTSTTVIPREPVDPNTATRDQLLALGLPSFFTSNLIKYREKGGAYHSLEDVEKLYGFNEEALSIATAYFRFPEERSFAKKKKPPVEVDINQADAETWKQLNGIGPGYAGRIIRFREKLGGFYRIDQVAETWGLPDSVFQKIRPFLRDSPITKKIPINRASAEELKAHPYISVKQAAWIDRYRQQHGPLQDSTVLATCPLFSEEETKRLIPYLDFAAGDD